MATVNDVLELAKALEGKAVVPAAVRCVAVRNRNSSCRRCVDACFANAITVKENEIALDNGACVACGACVAACPTEALVPLDPTDDELAHAVVRSSAFFDAPTVVIACARAATHGDGDPDAFAVVPCLGRVGELLLVELAARGVRDIVLVDGGCETCKYRAADAHVDEAVVRAQALLSAVGAAELTAIVRSSEFPAAARLVTDREQLGASRRSFLSNASGMAKDAAKIAAEQAIAQRLQSGQEKKVATLRDKLGVRDGGKLPVFSAGRNLRMLDALYELGEEAGASFAADGLGAEPPAEPPAELCVESRLFGSIQLDVEKCTGCGMCTMFCPTDAVRTCQDEHPRADESFRYFEFSAADCVQCGLCVDVCLQHAVTLSTAVPLSELFDFEPRLLDAKKPAKRPALFMRRR